MSAEGISSFLQEQVRVCLELQALWIADVVVKSFEEQGTLASRSPR
jgi:hypothetical protein